MPDATMPRCQYAMPMFNDVNVQHYDATRRCRLNATMQSQGRYETRQSLTRRRLDATMPDATMPNATVSRCQYAMPMFNDVNVQRDDATRRRRLNATMQSQGRYETRQSLTRRRLDATMPNATMPRDDADSISQRRLTSILLLVLTVRR